MNCLANPGTTQKIIDKEVARIVKEKFDTYAHLFYVCNALSMCDEGGISPDDVLRITKYATKLCDEVIEGRINFDDMENTLWDDYKIKFEIKSKR